MTRGRFSLEIDANSDLFLAAAPGVQLTREAFDALLVDLIAERVVTRPCLLWTGKVRKGGLVDPLELGVHGMSHVYEGGSSTQLRAALAKAPYAAKDVVVWFEGFDLKTNAAQAEAFEAEGWDNAIVLLWGLARPRTIPIGKSGELPEAQYFATVSAVGHRAMTELQPQQLLPQVLTRHLGPLRSATAWS